MPQRVLALEIGAHEFKAAFVEASFRDYRVVAFHRGDIAVDGSSRADQLKRFLTTHGLLGATTVLSALPADIVTWRMFSLPFRDRAKLAQIVPFELEGQVPFGLDDVVVDYHIIRRAKEGSKVLAALVRREDLESHLRLLTDAGLDPKVIDVSSLAMLNVLHLMDTKLPETFVYIAGNDEHITVALFRDNELLALRTVTPPQAGPPLAEVVAADEGEVVPAVSRLEATLAEIRWTLMALADEPPPAGTLCLVGGEGVLCDGIHATGAASLGLTAKRIDVAAMKQVPAELRSQVASFLTPIGLAMREVSPNDSMGINFRRGEFAYHRADQETRGAIRRTLILAGVLVAVVIGHTFVEYQRLAARMAVIDVAVKDVFRQTLPNAVPGTDPSGQLQAIIDTEQKKLDMLAQVVPVDGATSIDAVRALAIALPPTLHIEVEEFTMDTGQIRLKAMSDSFESVDSIKQKVAATNYFGNVEVKNVKTGQDPTKIDFLLMLDLSKTPPPPPPL